MRKKEGRRMTFTEKMVLLNELRKEDELRKMRMTDEQIDAIAEHCWKTDEDLQFFDYKKFARAIEERHGIK
jgi:hypothetical protein